MLLIVTLLTILLANYFLLVDGSYDCCTGCNSGVIVDGKTYCCPDGGSLVFENICRCSRQQRCSSSICKDFKDKINIHKSNCTYTQDIIINSAPIEVPYGPINVGVVSYNGMMSNSFNIDHKQSKYDYSDMIMSKMMSGSSSLQIDVTCKKKLTCSICYDSFQTSCVG